MDTARSPGGPGLAGRGMAPASAGARAGGLADEAVWAAESPWLAAPARPGPPRASALRARARHASPRLATATLVADQRGAELCASWRRANE